LIYLNTNPAKSWLKTTILRFDKLRLGTQFMVPERRFMAVDDPSSLSQATPWQARLHSGKLRRGTPVNRRIPIARNRFENIRKILGV
jgi:hypothetical protein